MNICYIHVCISIACAYYKVYAQNYSVCCIIEGIMWLHHGKYSLIYRYIELILRNQSMLVKNLHISHWYHMCQYVYRYTLNYHDMVIRHCYLTICWQFIVHWNHSISRHNIFGHFAVSIMYWLDQLVLKFLSLLCSFFYCVCNSRSMLREVLL